MATIWQTAPGAFPNQNGSADSGYAQNADKTLIYTIGGHSSGSGGGMNNAVTQYDGNGYTGLAGYPQSVEGAAACVADGDLWGFGGSKSSDVAAQAHVYRLVNGVWTQKAPLPQIRQYLAPTASVIGRKVYVIGGAYNGDASVHSSTYEYDLDTDTWATKASMPGPRADHLQLIHNGKIYVLGGWTTWGGGFTASVLIYDPATNTWDSTSAMSMPGIRQRHSGFVGPDGNFYIFGGQDGVTLNQNGHPELPTCWKYNPTENKWYDFTPDMSTANLPAGGVPRSAQFTGYIGDQIYLLGGYYQNGYTSTGGYVTQTVWDALPGTVFTGEATGAAIYPAPEPIPHRLSEADFPNMDRAQARRLARMLNENFDSTERQLLALDPDTQNNRYGR